MRNRKKHAQRRPERPLCWALLKLLSYYYLILTLPILTSIISYRNSVVHSLQALTPEEIYHQLYQNTKPKLPKIQDLNQDAGIFFQHEYYLNRYEWTPDTYNTFISEVQTPGKIANELWQTDIQLSHAVLKSSLCTPEGSLYSSRHAVKYGDQTFALGLQFDCESDGKTKHTRNLAPFRPDLINMVNNPDSFSFDHLEVLMRIVDYFQHCPVNENYRLISEKSLNAIYKKIEEKYADHGGTLSGMLPAEIKNFNWNRMPCCHSSNNIDIDLQLFNFTKNIFSSEQFHNTLYQTPELTVSHLYNIFKKIETDTGEDLEIDKLGERLERILESKLDKRLLSHPELAVFFENSEPINHALQELSDKIPSENFRKLRSHALNAGNVFIDESIVYMIGHGLEAERQRSEKLENNQAKNKKTSKSINLKYSFLLSEGFVNLGLRYKMDGYLGQAMSCFRSALEHEIVDEKWIDFEKGVAASGIRISPEELETFENPRKELSHTSKEIRMKGFKVKSINALGILTRTIYFYDKSEHFKLTKQLINTTLQQVFRAFTAVSDIKESSDHDNLKKFASKDQQDILDILDWHQLGGKKSSPGICLAIFTLFELITQSEIEVIQEGLSSLEDNVDDSVIIRSEGPFICNPNNDNPDLPTLFEYCHYDRVGFHILKFMFQIWVQRCSHMEQPLDYKIMGERKTKGIKIRSKTGELQYFMEMQQKLKSELIRLNQNINTDQIANPHNNITILKAIEQVIHSEEIDDKLRKYYDETIESYIREFNQYKLYFVLGMIVIVLYNVITYLPGDEEETNRRNRLRVSNGSNKNNSSTKSRLEIIKSKLEQENKLLEKEYAERCSKFSRLSKPLSLYLERFWFLTKLLFGIFNWIYLLLKLFYDVLVFFLYSAPKTMFDSLALEKKKRRNRIKERMQKLKKENIDNNTQNSQSKSTHNEFHFTNGQNFLENLLKPNTNDPNGVATNCGKYDSKFSVDKNTGRIKVELKLGDKNPNSENSRLEMEKYRSKLQFVYDLLMKNIVEVEKRLKKNHVMPGELIDSLLVQILKDPNQSSRDCNLKAYNHFKDIALKNVNTFNFYSKFDHADLKKDMLNGLPNGHHQSGFSSDSDGTSNNSRRSSNTNNNNNAGNLSPKMGNNNSNENNRMKNLKVRNRKNRSRR